MFYAGVFFLLLSIGTNAQTKAGVDYFVGKWNLSAETVPGGGAKMVVTLERKEGKLEGTIEVGDEGKIKFSKIEEKGSSVTLYFTSSHSNDVSINLEKKDDNHVGGSVDTAVMGIFDVKGERIDENGHLVPQDSLIITLTLTGNHSSFRKWQYKINGGVSGSENRTSALALALTLALFWYPQRTKVATRRLTILYLIY